MAVPGAVLPGWAEAARGEVWAAEQALATAGRGYRLEVLRHPEAPEQEAALREELATDHLGRVMAIPPDREPAAAVPRVQLAQAVRAREARVQIGWRSVAVPGAAQAGAVPVEA